MNEKMKNSIYRLSTMISLMGRDGAGGTSINKLSEIMGVNKDTLYADIISIKKDGEYKINIFTDDERYEDDFQMDLTDENTASLKKFINNLKSGLYDDIQIYSSVPYRKYELILSSDELELLQDFMKKDLDKNYERGSSYYIKGYSPEHNEEYVNKMLFIIDSIDNGDSMEMEYFNGKNLSKKIIRPIKVVNNTDDGLIYVFDHRGQFYRVDRIKKIKPSDKKQNISSNVDIDKLNKMWGINFSGEYTHVRLKIFDEGNVLERVKKDLGEKVTEESFKEYKEEGYVIYEDDVIGVDSFITWIYSYGSSMVLLSPDHLVKRIVESIKARKDIMQI